MTWTQTHTGKRFDIFYPRPEDICIEDIAHALAHQCRFNGHTKEFYSVAEHSLNCARLASVLTADPHALMSVLLHDAHEAYLGDIPGPWRKLVYLDIPDGQHIPSVSRSIKAVTQHIDDAIAESLGLLPGIRNTELVKVCDMSMLINEKRLALAVPDMIWESTASFTPHPDHQLRRLDFYKPAEAAFHFHHAFQEIHQCLSTGPSSVLSALLSPSHLRTSSASSSSASATGAGA